MVYATAIAALLFYAANVPLCIAFSLQIGKDFHAGFGFAAFRGRSALERAYAWKPRTQKEQPKKADQKSRLPIRFLLLASWEMIQRIERFRIHARIGTGDAASTALACGALNAFFSIFAESDISPIFDQAQLELSGIIEIRAGNIIRAVATAGLQARPKERKNANGKTSD